jgi:hypothetical protein
MLKHTKGNLLDLAEAGERIVVPVDLEHARTMFKLACHYLSCYDPEFELKLDWN